MGVVWVWGGCRCEVGVLLVWVCGDCKSDMGVVCVWGACRCYMGVDGCGVGVEWL